MWSSVRGGHLFHGGKGIHVLFDGQRRTRGMDEPLVMSYDVGHWHIFSRQHARSRAWGLLNEPRRGWVHGKGTHCMGGGISVCLLMGNVGKEAWVSPPCWATMLAIDTFCWGNMLTWGLEPRRIGMRLSTRGGHSLHEGDACPHGHGTHQGCSVYGAQGDCCFMRGLPMALWACSLHISVSWAWGWHMRVHDQTSLLYQNT